MDNKYTNSRKDTVFTKLGIIACMGMIVFSFLISPPTFAQISGSVYRDYNSDGFRGNAEDGLAGMNVSATDENGNTATAVTTFDGSYQLSFANCNGAVRVEFGLNAFNTQTASTDDDYYCSTIGGGNSVTSVAFVNCGASAVNFAVNHPSDYCELDPSVIVPCFVGGNPLADCSGLLNSRNCAGESDVLVGFNYSASGDANSSDLDHLALGHEVGSVWGLTYQNASKQLFTSSVIRSHTGLGPLGTGGIYKLNISGGTYNPAVTNYIDLNTLCGSAINLGADPHENLTANKTTPAHDNGGILNAGKQGLGGIALSTNEEYLYVVNLTEKSLHKIFIDNPAKPIITCDDVTTFAIPSACSNVGDSRPWAVSTWRGKVYVGTVCSGESGNGELIATVYEFNEPSTWNPVVTWTLEDDTDTKGCTNGDFGCEWGAWATGYPETFGSSIIDPQPILADIEFDADGSMVIGMLDRTGFQGGYRNFFYPAPDQNLYSSFSGGDILRAQWNGNTWVMESNGQFPGVANAPVGCGVDNGQGIGGGEFYCGDDWEGDNHQETSLGGLAMLLGTGEVMSSAFDPTQSINSGGVQKYQNSDGSNIITGDNQNDDDYAVYHNAEQGTFGKATGIGDVELLCGVAPIEIGNLIWADSNGNGIQDAGEAGVSGVTVGLYDSNGNQLATTTTGADGSYYFNNTNVSNGVNANTIYTVQIENTNFSGAGNLNGYQVTAANSSTDVLDSDGVNNNGVVAVTITTGNNGQSDHSIDFGFIDQIDLALTKTADVSIADVGDMVTYTITVTNEGAGTATGIQVSEAFPAGLVIQSTNTSQGDLTASSIWNVGSLNSGVSATLTVVTQVSTVGDIINTAEIISHDQTDVDSTPNNQNNIEDDIATVVIKSQQVDLELSKTANVSGNVTVGSNFVYTVSLTNQGPSTATGLVVTDILPTEVQFVSVTPNLYDNVTGIWNVGSLMAGETTSIAIEVTVLNDGTITNVAQLTGLNESDIDSTPNNNIATEDDQDSVTITAEPSFNCSSFTITSGETTPIICSDTNSGSILILTSGGTAPYSYAINGGTPSTTEGASVSINGLPQGSHVITFTDANNCVASYSFTIAQTPNPTASITSNIPASCGGANGSIDVAVNGEGSLTVSLNGGQTQTGTSGIFSFDGIAGGNYTISVTDGNGCTGSTAVSVNVITAPTITLSSSSPSLCGGANGVLSFSIVGEGSMTITLDSGQSFSGFSGTYDFKNIPAGTYLATVTDANNCNSSITSNVITTPPPSISISGTTQATCGNTDGSISVIVIGEGNLTLSLNNGQTQTGSGGTYTFTGLAAGNFIATVEDANGCDASISTAINETTAPTISFDSATPAQCGSNSGVLGIVVVGDGVLTITLNTGETISGATGNYQFPDLAGGSYTATVEDENGCTASLSSTINETAAPTIVLTDTDAASCGNATGSVSFTTTGEGSLTIALSNGETVTGNAGTYDFDNLPAGTYTATVTDSNNCTSDVSGTVTDTEAPTISMNNITSDVCNAGQGEISFTVSGIGSLNVSLSDGQSLVVNSGTFQFTGLSADNYTVTVSDDNNCSTSVATAIQSTVNPVISFDSSEFAACGNSNGSFSVTVVGESDLTISTNTGETQTGASGTYEFTGLSAGSYTTTVTDANNCEASVSIAISETDAPEVNVSNTTDATCSGDTGTLSVAVSGSNTMTIELNTGEIQTGTSGTYTFSGLAAGTYTVAVDDENDCMAAVTATIGETTAPTISVGSTANASCGIDNGSLTMNVVGIGNLTITLDNGLTDAGISGAYQFTGLASGTYVATVEDANGCSTTATATISQTDGPSIGIASTTDAACGNNNGVMGVQVNGEGTLTIALSNGETLTGVAGVYEFTNLSGGTYSATITDSSNCTDTINGTINEADAPTIVVDSTTPEACGNSEGSIIIIVNGNGSMTITSNNGETFTGNSGTYQFTNLTSGDYTITATDASNCSASTTANVSSINDTFNVSVGDVTDAACDQANNGTVELIIDINNYMLSWSGNTNGSQMNDNVVIGLSAGVYEFTVTNIATSCFTTVQTSVSNLQSINYVANPVGASCADESDGGVTLSISTSDGTGMTVDFGQGTIIEVANAATEFVNLPSGTYNVSFTDANGCVLFEEITVPGPSPIDYSIEITNAEGCDATNGSVTVNATGGSGDYILFYNDNTTGGTSISGLGAGDYTANLVDGNCGEYLIAFTIGENCQPTTEENEPPCSYTEETCTLNQTALEYCVTQTGCDPNGDNIFITEVHSLYDCSLTMLNDSCFRYLPLPGFVDQIDQVTITICDDGSPTLCSVIILEIVVSEECSEDPIITGSSISGIVWSDFNENANLDGNEIGVFDVVVVLTYPNGSTQTTVTGLTGGYDFTDLTAGTYTVEVFVPNGFNLTTVGNYTINLGTEENNTGNNFGIHQPPSTSGPCEDTLKYCIEPLKDITVCVPNCLADEGAIKITETVSTYGCSIYEVNDTCVRYLPLPGFLGNDFVIMTVCDNETETDCYIVILDIFVSTEGCENPIAQNDNACVTDGTVTINPIENDSHPINLDFSITEVGNANFGITTLNDNGTITYQAGSDFTIGDSFSYTICDEQGLCDQALISLTPCDDKSCDANAGIIVAPNPAISADGQTLAPTVSGQQTANGFTYVYILTTDMVENDGIVYDIVDVNTSGIFNLNNYNYEEFNIHGLSFEGTVDELLTLGATTGEQVMAAIDLEAICADLTVPGYTVSTVTTDCVNTQEICAEPTILIEVCPDFCDIDDVTSIVNTITTFNCSVHISDENPLCVQYIALPGYVGLDSLFIIGANDAGTLDTSLYFINVGSCFAPDAQNDIYLFDAGEGSYTFNPLDNDSDPCTRPVTPTILLAPEIGEVVINEDDSFTLNAPEDYVGTITFTYQICNNCNQPMCDDAIVSITLEGEAPTPPTASPDIVTTAINTPVTFNVLTNDSGNGLVITDYTIPSSGTITIDENGNFVYTPEEDFTGTVYFDYTICDENNVCVSTGVNINVLDGLNQAPTTNNDQAVTDTNTTVTIDVLANDSDPENGNLTITDVIQPDSCGVVNIIANGTLLEFVPDETCDPQEVIFEYIVCDAEGACDTATVAVSVGLPDGNTNNAPEANNDNAEVAINGTISINVLANDIDPEGDDINVTTISGEPENGTATIDPNTGEIIYTPNTDYAGTDNLIYIVCDNGIPVLCDTALVEITVGIAGNGPTANEDLVSTAGGNDVIIDVIANDEGTGINVTEVTQPENGMVVINPDGMVTYTPNAEFIGDDYFTYTICDSFGLCDSTVVGVHVSDPAVNQAPIGGNDVFVLENCNPIELDVLANDVDPENDELTIEGSSFPDSCGAVEINEANQTLIYTPICEGECTTNPLTFIYIVCDDLETFSCDTVDVIITFEPAPINNLPPTAVNDEETTGVNTAVNFNVINNDFDINQADTLSISFVTNPNNGTVTWDANGNMEYTPNVDFEGEDNFFYIVCDNGFPVLCDTAYVAIMVEDLNSSIVVANPDYTMTPINTGTFINVLGNDEGNNLSITEYTDSANGSVSYDSLTVSLVYFPNPEFVGTDNFTYTICDDEGNCDETFVVIEVFDGFNQAPVGSNDVGTVDLGGTVTIDVLANDGDPENGELTLTDVIQTDTCGTAEIIDNEIVFTASDSSECSETTVSFDYVVCDAELNCDTATVVVSIGTEVNNNPPTGVDEMYTVVPNQSVEFNVLTDDFDIDGDSIGVSSITDPTNGTLVWDVDGNVTYMPDSGFTGNDYLSYILCDDGTPILCDTAFVELFVDPDLLADETDLTPDVVIANLNTPEEIDVLANDTGNGLTVTSNTEPENGTLLLDEDSQIFTYFPNPDFCGEDFFFYTACDINDQCDSTLVSINVLCDGENVPPTAVNDVVELPDTLTTICIDVLANDFDENSDTLIITNVTNPALGIAVFNINEETGLGEVCYTVNEGVTDTLDVFEYIVCDGFLPAAECDTAQVVIIIGDAEITNLPPVAEEDEASANAGSSVTICVADNDTDPNEGDELTVSLLNNPANGSIELDENGCVVYTPNDGFDGTDYFPYAVCDNGIPSMCDTAYVTVQVIESDINAEDDSASTFNGESVTIDVLDNDNPSDFEDIDNITIVTDPINGTATIDDNGNIVYTPNDDYFGTDSLVYEICVNEICDQATVFITVEGCELFIKNGISPNGDNINDVFDIPGLNECYGDNNPELIIFNRWGNQIAKIKGYTGRKQDAWDGTWKGEDVPDGTYFYVLILNTGNKDDNRNGFIEVLR